MFVTVKAALFRIMLHVYKRALVFYIDLSPTLAMIGLALPTNIRPLMTFTSAKQFDFVMFPVDVLLTVTFSYVRPSCTISYTR